MSKLFEDFDWCTEYYEAVEGTSEGDDLSSTYYSMCNAYENKQWKELAILIENFKKITKQH